MSFFLPKGRLNPAKRKAVQTNGDTKKRLVPKKKALSKRPNEEEDEILSDDPGVEGAFESDDGDDDILSTEETETAEEKRLRLAKRYLEEIEREEQERKEAQSSGHVHDAVTERLKRDELEESGKLRLLIASQYSKEKVPSVVAELRVLRDHKFHKLSITCLALTSDGCHIFSGSKDGGLVMWELKTGKKMARVPGGRKSMEAKHRGHCSTVHALAVSTDNAFLASGDDSKLIHVWKIASNVPYLDLTHTFKGHRDAVSGLAFRRRTHTLYSCSYDRSVKVWNLDEMAYVETLFGHQDRITGIDAGVRERAVTSGGRDGSVRVWKIAEESQLVYNGPATSTDAVKLINEEHFVTCGEDGHVSLWSALKKKPLYTVACAHGKDESNAEPRWISAIATLHCTDLIATGSNDGVVRLWQCSNDFRSLKEINSFNVKGFVNALHFTADGSHLVIGLGQEHRLGRWWRCPEARNCIVLAKLNRIEQ